MTPDLCTPVCGDGVKTIFEECDDHNLIAGDGCSATCLKELSAVCVLDSQNLSICDFCGNGITKHLVELCDDGT